MPPAAEFQETVTEIPDWLLWGVPLGLIAIGGMVLYVLIRHHARRRTPI